MQRTESGAVPVLDIDADEGGGEQPVDRGHRRDEHAPLLGGPQRLRARTTRVASSLSLSSNAFSARPAGVRRTVRHPLVGLLRGRTWTRRSASSRRSSRLR